MSAGVRHTKHGVDLDLSLLPPRDNRPKLTKADMRKADELTLRAITRRLYRYAADSSEDARNAQAELRRRGAFG